MDVGSIRRSIRVQFATRDQSVLFITLLLILLGVVVIPLGYVLAFSFAPEFPLIGPFVPTLSHYAKLVSNVDLLVSITVDTAIFAAGDVLFALVIGITAAILEEKYLGGRSRFRILMMLPYGLPTVASVTGWIWLMGRAGVITKLVVSLFGLAHPPWDIYSMWGMIFVDGLHTAPLAFLLIAPSIGSIPAAAEEAGLAAGASRLRVFRKIVLPLVLPAILSISIFLLARSMAVVTVPAILGVPKNIYTFGSAIPFLYLSGFSLDYSLSLAFGVYITIITGFLIVIYYRAIGKAEKFSTISGQGSTESKIYDVGPVKKALIGLFFVGYLFVGGLLPFWAVIWDSLLPGFHFTLSLSTLTLHNYVALFNGNLQGVSDFVSTLKNTLLVAVAVPTIAMVISFLLSFSKRTSAIPYAGALEFTASVPLAIPTIVISLAFLALFIATPLYGTVILIVIAFLARAIPIGLRYTSPALTKIGIENVEAATSSGYGELRTFKDVVLPLAKSDFVAGWMNLFVFSVRNVSIPILLFTTDTQVMSITLLNLLKSMFFKSAATIAVILTVISIIPYMALQYWRIRSASETVQVHE